MKYAKDPIDFIRHFTFATWTKACGVNTASTRIDTALTIRLTSPHRTANGSCDVPLKSNCRTQAVKAVADWLTKDSRFTVLPYAEVLSTDAMPGQDAIQTIVLQLTGTDDLETFALEISHLAAHVNTVMDHLRTNSAQVIHTKEEREAMNANAHMGGGYGGPSMGRSPLETSRAPQQDISRVPTSMYHGNTSGFKNFEDK